MNATPTLARAILKGSNKYPDIRGTVWFQDVPMGTMVCTFVKGLPSYTPATDDYPQIGPFGFHLHEKGTCGSPEGSKPFMDAGGHYNPDSKPHGDHAGDFPILFSYNGISKICFFTDRFRVADIVGKSVVIHESPDDFTSQPSGDSGIRIACGTVKAIPTFNIYPVFFSQM